MRLAALFLVEGADSLNFSSRGTVLRTFVGVALLLMELLLLPNAFADSVTLKCRDSDGSKTGDLEIDIGKRQIKWGAYEYQIVHLTDTYISAYLIQNGVGGEVYVINRITGEYKRGNVGIFYTKEQADAYKPGDEGSFEAQIYQGRCGKQQF